MTSRSSRQIASQGGLFDSPQAPDPEPDPEAVCARPPAEKAVGEPSPGPDPIPRNVATGTIQIDDARRFVAWVHAQEISIHADVTVGHVLVGLSGFQPSDLRWLCQAIRQAGHAPTPGAMRSALLQHDVGLLRRSADD